MCHKAVNSITKDFPFDSSRSTKWLIRKQQLTRLGSLRYGELVRLLECINYRSVSRQTTRNRWLNLFTFSSSRSSRFLFRNTCQVIFSLHLRRTIFQPFHGGREMLRPWWGFNLFIQVRLLCLPWRDLFGLMCIEFGFSEMITATFLIDFIPMSGVWRTSTHLSPQCLMFIMLKPLVRVKACLPRSAVKNHPENKNVFRLDPEQRDLTF